MKKLVLILIVATSYTTSSFATPDQCIKILSTKRNIMYFKASKEMIGATVEIENFNHQIIETSTVEKSKTIVDFFFLPAGTYTVKIKKGDKEFDFEYSNV